MTPARNIASMLSAIPQNAAVVAHQSACSFTMTFEALKVLFTEVPFVELGLFVIWAVDRAFVFRSLFALLAYEQLGIGVLPQDVSQELAFKS